MYSYIYTYMLIYIQTYIDTYQESYNDKTLPGTSKVPFSKSTIIKDDHNI